MKEIDAQPDRTTTKKSLFDLFTELVGWFQIFASPFLVGLIIGSIIYLPKPNTLRFIIAILITILGLVTGIVWATTVWKKRGTVHFMSKITATPELDKPEDQE